MLLSVEQEEGSHIRSGLQPEQQNFIAWNTEPVLRLRELCSHIGLCLHRVWTLIMQRGQHVTSHNLMGDDLPVPLSVEKEEGDSVSGLQPGEHENTAWNTEPIECLCGVCSHSPHFNI